MYAIRMGVPEMKGLWDDHEAKAKAGTLGKTEGILYKKWGKAMAFLAQNPKHRGLQSHEIGASSRRYGTKVWRLYLEYRTPAAGRFFWVYGPGNGEITVIGLEPHPEDQKSAGYAKVRLSETGSEDS